MVVNDMQFTLKYGNLVAPLILLSSVSVALKLQNFISNFTINKTWHADCNITAVSKILDWLVK